MTRQYLLQKVLVNGVVTFRQVVVISCLPESLFTSAPQQRSPLSTLGPHAWRRSSWGSVLFFSWATPSGCGHSTLTAGPSSLPKSDRTLCHLGDPRRLVHPPSPARVRLPSEVLHFQASGHIHLLSPLPRPRPQAPCLPQCTCFPAPTGARGLPVQCHPTPGTAHGSSLASRPLSNSSFTQAAGVRPREGPPPPPPLWKDRR